MKHMNSAKRWNKLRSFLALLLASQALFLSACGAGPADAPDMQEEAVFSEETAASLPADEKEEDTGASPGSPKGADRMFYVHVHGRILPVLAAENTSAEAFLELLKSGDLTVSMHDYGGFEKVGPLGTALPRNDEQITTEPGDVILYQGDQITIYYDVNRAASRPDSWCSGSPRT